MFRLLKKTRQDVLTAEELLRDILMVRMFGEKNLTPSWRELDSRIEHFLRRNDKETNV